MSFPSCIDMLGQPVSLEVLVASSSLRVGNSRLSIQVAKNKKRMSVSCSNWTINVSNSDKDVFGLEFAERTRKRGVIMWILS